MLATDKTVLGHAKVEPGVVKVQFADGVSESPEALARTATLLQQAEAASIGTRVGLVHPDWTPEQIADEVAAIQAERGAPMTDPFAITE